MGLPHLSKQASKMNSSFVVKIKQLLATCQTQSPSGLHLSRQKFIIGLVLAMMEARQVQFPEMALRFPSPARVESTLRRIQRFFADFLLCDLWMPTC